MVERLVRYPKTQRITLPKGPMPWWKCALTAGMLMALPAIPLALFPGSILAKIYAFWMGAMFMHLCRKFRAEGL